MGRLMNTQEAAEFLGVSQSWLNHNAGHLGVPRKRLGPRLWRYDPDELRAYLDSQAGA
ncbi:MAG: helix-turn-helix transcriptional regulator [Candidatus Nanopelagicales bacterium]